MTKRQADPRNLIYTASELATGHVQLAEKIQSEPGITWGIPDIDSRVLPMRGGDVTLICARPGAGKTTIMAYLAQHEAMSIEKRGTQDSEVVLYATWEGTVDTIYAAIIAGKGGYTSSDFYWGRVPIEKVTTNVVQHGTMPIMMLGFSTLRCDPAPMMTLDVLFQAVESIESDFGLRPTLVCLDYLQLIPNPRSTTKINQVAQAIVNAKMLGMKMDVPFVLGAQASRDVDEYAEKLPMMKDVQWSSQAEQHTDKLFGLWRPAQTESRDAQGRPPMVQVDGAQYEALDNLLIMRLLKQRGEHGRHTWGLHLAPELLELTALETQNLNDAF